ncbi:SHOCT domain-containing protein [Nocardia tengchongensis]|uniref:SHOCT domain-containing protein n=1 Tax=Nocardia tengchongensis TaxID=2055889 RepID=A0ABX8CKL2_9NOCA|nr:SHOCT domain-containing protein [Nocardia tengchongensis]QVI19388.1 SHOCT domain-containing protein [Nocardia tengchongensis]
MMYWNDHDMSGWGYAWMSVGMLIFWALVIGGIAIAIRFALADRDTTPRSASPSPQELLAQRFARGEIDETEYSTRLAALRAAGAP